MNLCIKEVLLCGAAVAEFFFFIYFAVSTHIFSPCFVV